MGCLMRDKKAHHQRIAAILSRMNADVLEEADCVFGGGTSIALQINEFRLSTDIDFLCASQEGYRMLRGLIGQYSMTGLSQLFIEPVTQIREVRADRYGIRSVLEFDGTPVKFEIVREDRIDLDPPREKLHGVPLITREDAFAEKLLANSDRWGDVSVLSRDVLDIAAMIQAWGNIPIGAENKVYRAYGSTVLADLQLAAQRLLEKPGYREKAFTELAIDLKDQPAIIYTLECLQQGGGIASSPSDLTGGPRYP